MATLGSGSGSAEDPPVGHTGTTKRQRVDKSKAHASVDRGLSVSELKSVQLWAAAVLPNTSAAHKSKSRTPADVARLRFFEGVDAIAVEGHILTALLLLDYDDRISKFYHNVESLQRRLEKFQCWPISKQDWEYIRTATRMTGIDVVSNPFLSELEWDQVQDWLGKFKRLWKNKILAAALSVRLRSLREGEQPKIKETKTAGVGVLDCVPKECFVAILSYAEFSSLKSFSAASSSCRYSVRQHPQLRDSWRSNLFYANSKASKASDDWNWKVVCAENVPDATVAPVPLDSAFTALGTICNDGGLCSWAHRSVSPKKLREGRASEHGILELQGKALQTRNLSFTTNQVEVSNQGSFFSFFCRNPFGPSIKPTAISGYVPSPGYAVMAMVGYDGFGGFIGAGTGHFYSDDGGHDLTFCCRYLSPGDDRMCVSSDLILALILPINPGRNMDFTASPWRSHLFNLKPTPSVGLAPVPSSALSSMPPIPGFELQLKLTCDLRRFMNHRLLRSLMDYLIETAQEKHEDFSKHFDTKYCCVNCGERENIAHVSYHDEQVIGHEDLLYALKQEELMFCERCDNACFLEWIGNQTCVDCVSNVLWKHQCWGCGSVGNSNMSCKIWHYSAYGEVQWGFLGDDGTICFCSSQCALAALPEILRICLEWQTHDLTCGQRKLALYNDIKLFCTKSMELLKHNGWKDICREKWILEDLSWIG